jgi:hypothetical protein
MYGEEYACGFLLGDGLYLRVFPAVRNIHTKAGIEIWQPVLIFAYAARASLVQ